ncbi:MAG: hypothetical protein Q9M20_01075 [Mariprofundaceae bacterium]|nr:hypothetical protein [Mariprofundaceae bacterium]
MKIPPEEVELFYQLMSYVIRFSHNLAELFSDRTFGEDIRENLTQQEIFELKSDIYDNPQLINAYVAKNPDQLNDESLAIIDSWQFAIRGAFYIERYLKDHAIFIQQEKVYAVHALNESFDYIIPKSALPTYAIAVLLPFKGGIIYDGQMQINNIHFGGGIKRRLKDEYMAAKRQNKIIYSLNPADNKATENKVASIPQKDWSNELAQLKAIAKKLKGGSGQPEAHGAAFCLLRAAIELAELAISEDRDYGAIRKGVSKVNRSITRLWKNI